MKTLFSRIIALAVSLAFVIPSADACTSAVVTGKATPDGRPLLWKNRDTDYLPNHVAHVKGPRFDFIANVNSENFDSVPEAWIGVNSAGFALMNTQSYNLVKIKPGEERGAANGSIIYRALGICETVDDFRNFLDTIAKPSLIEANFGVIDAKGGAAFFETDYYGYTMYDANDPEVAPEGYIARTNFSVSGKEGKCSGYVRYLEADSVLKASACNSAVDVPFIMNSLSRSFHNPVIGIDLRDGAYNLPNGSGWFVDEDFIPRNITSCSVIVQGVKDGEAPDRSVMWTLLGYPPAGVTVPVLLPSEGMQLPEATSYNAGLKTSPLSKASLDMADEVFGYDHGNGTRKYLNWEKLYNNNGDGYMQRLVPVEEEIYRLSQPMVEQWRQGKLTPETYAETYRVINVLLQPWLPDWEHQEP